MNFVITRDPQGTGGNTGAGCTLINSKRLRLERITYETIQHIIDPDGSREWKLEAGHSCEVELTIKVNGMCERPKEISIQIR